MSETKEYKLGATANCISCGNEIHFQGDYWAHIEKQPRHPAIPEQDFKLDSELVVGVTECEYCGDKLLFPDIHLCPVRYRQQEQRIAELEKALAFYGHHKKTCAERQPSMGILFPECDCGYRAALLGRESEAGDE